MEIYLILLESLNYVWMILLLSFLTVFAGWVAGYILARLFVNLINRTPLINFAVKIFKLSDAEIINLRMKQIFRFLFLVLSFWTAWIVLTGHPQISEFISWTELQISEFFQLAVVKFILNVLLITLETVILLKAVKWIKKGFEIISLRIAAERDKHLKGFKIQQVELISAGQITAFFLSISRYLRYGINILLVIIYLTGIFSVFPQTRDIVSGILYNVFHTAESGWLSFVNYVPSLLNLLGIVAVTYYGLKAIRFVFNEIEKGTIVFSGFYSEWAMPSFQLVRFLIIALSLVVAFPYLPGSSSPAFQGVSVFIGVLLSLGSTSVVSNIVSGIVLTYTRAFQIGDRVRISDTVGDVIEKGLLVTRVKTIKNVIITIPNNMVMGSHIINYNTVSKDTGLILNTTITLGYDVSWRLVHETLVNAAQGTSGILKDPKPFVHQTALNDFYVSYELNAHTDQPHKMASIYSELHQNIQDFCGEAGIEILSPHYGAVRDGNSSTIPARHLPDDYKAPPFNIRIHDSDKNK